MPAEAPHGESAGSGSCFHAEVVASLQTNLGEDSRADSFQSPPHADTEAPRTLRKPLRTEPSLSTQDPSKASTALWVQQRGWRRGHSFPPRASPNDNQLLPGGDQGTTTGAQVLGLLLATNRTVNVGPPASPLPQDQQHPGLVSGGKGGGLREPRPILLQLRPAPELGRNAKPCLPLGNRTSLGLPADLRPLHH